MPAGPPIIAAVFAWLHLVTIGIGAGLLLAEHWMCRRLPDRLQARLLGQVDLGDRTLIGSGVQILSGTGQHVRDANGRLTDEGRVFRRIRVGTDCWVGAASTVMADLGAYVTVAPGSVVSRDVPANATVAGNPARVVRATPAELREAG